MIQIAEIIAIGITAIGLVLVAISKMLAGGTLILVLACIVLHIGKPLVALMPMPGVRCPTCAERGIEQWVLPGKHCPRCSTACRGLVGYYHPIITLFYLFLGGFLSVSGLWQIISYLFFF